MTEAAAPAAVPALAVRGAGVRIGARWVLRDISLEVRAGEMLAVIGPNGAGKTTLARAILGWQGLHTGEVWIGGRHWSAMGEGERRRLRPGEVQLIYQDPGRSLDPVQRVGAILAEAGCRGPAAEEWLERVGLPAEFTRRLPAELSGGQRQRVAIARAFACRPRVLVADEPTSALDTVAAGQVLELLDGLRRETGLACLFITHQLAWARRLADRVAVLSPEGRVVETGGAGLLADPGHALTEALVAAVPPWPV